MQNYRVPSADSLQPNWWGLQIMELKLLAYVEYSRPEIINPFCGIKQTDYLSQVKDSKHRMKCSISKLFTFWIE